MPGISAVSPPTRAQPASRQRLGDAGEHLARGADIEPAGREVVEEEQRLGALHDEVVDAHRDEVDADRLVPAGGDRDLELGADPVGGRDQDRIA